MARTKKNTALVLRTCKSDLTSRGGFQWADVGGTTVAEDWIENKECGNGLHGWLFGSGDHSYSNYLDADSKWMVLEVDLKSIVMLGEKCKFPKAKTVFVGDKKSATDYLIANEPRAKNVSVIGASLEVGDNGSVLVGALGTATTGESGTATAGESGTATTGESGEIRIQYWDTKAERYRTIIGYIGEDGLKADTAYKLDENHKFVEAE